MRGNIRQLAGRIDIFGKRVDQPTNFSGIHADWVLVPVKGPEQASVQALPLLMDWIREAGHARVLAFLPTMHKARRSSSRHWLEQLEVLAERYDTKVLAPIGDLASIADWQLSGHPYAHVAEEILRATRI